MTSEKTAAVTEAETAGGSAGGGTGARESMKRARRRAGSGSGKSAGTATYINADGRRATGTVDYTDPYWTAMRDYYDRMYAGRAEVNDAAAAEAVERAAQAAQAERRRIDEGYRGVNRQLYRDYMENRRRLPQEQAARGYTGGLTESGLLRLANAYGENLAGNERARLSELAAADEALAQREYEARSAAARANAQAEQERYAYIAALRQQQYQQQRSDEKDRAAVLAGAGDYSGYGALGYSQEDIDYLSRMWRAKNPKLAGAQATGTAARRLTSAFDGSSALSAARSIRDTQGADAAVDYVAELLARGAIFSDEAERIVAILRGE